MSTKQCSTCGRAKPLEDFPKNGTRNGKQRYRSSCKVCEGGRNQERTEQILEALEPDELLLIHRLKERVRRLNKELKSMTAAYGQKERELDLLQRISGAKKAKSSKKKTKAKKKLPKAAAVLLCSDWHVEEPVDPDKVAGINEYNLDIAKQRIHRLLDGYLAKIDMHGSHHDITEAVVWLGGDLISGYIHEELMETNALSPAEAIMWLQEILIEFIEAVADTGLKVRVPCSYGNHGRTQPQKKISTAAENSYEWMLYKTLEKYFAKDPRVEFEVAKGPLLYLDVLGNTLLFSHGDTVKSTATGPFAAVARAKKSWDAFRRSVVACVGHWHTYHSSPTVVVNGSLIGPGSYSVHIGAAPERAQQAFFLIDAENGKCCDSPIWVD